MERHESDQIGSLLDGLGLLWIDVAYWDAWTEEKLVKLLGLDPRAARDCAVRNPLPKAHIEALPTWLVGLDGVRRGDATNE